MHLLIIIFIIFFLPTSVFAQKEGSYKTVELQYGISITIPLDWKVLPKKTLRQLDNSTEALSGINQSNNEILLAMNCYTFSKKPSATFRISVRKKKISLNQEMISNFTDDDIYFLNEEAKNRSIVLDKKFGTITDIGSIQTKIVSIANMRSIMTVKNVFEDKTTNIVLFFLIPISEGTVKIYCTYRKNEEKILMPILIHILESLKMKKV